MPPQNGKAKLSWSDVGIDLPPDASGHVYTTCPKCSAERSTAAHRAQKCLGVTVDADPPHWGCNHCGRAGSLAKGWTDDPEWSSGSTTKRRFYNPPAPLPKPDPESDKAKEWHDRIFGYYVNTRKIPREVLDRHKVVPKFQYMHEAEDGAGGYEWVLAIPFYERGKHVNTKYRTAKTKHMQQDAGTRKNWYGVDDIAGADVVAIVEGEVDKWSVEAAGMRACVSVPSGANSANVVDFAVFDKTKKIVIAVDEDEDGRKLADVLVSRFGRERCFKASFPDGCKDANDVLINHGADVLAKCLATAKEWRIEGTFTVPDVWERVLDLYKHGLDRGPSTGWPSFDRNYRPALGLSTIVTGIPGVGKSHFLHALLVNLMRGPQAWKIGMCSPEHQPLEQLVAMMATAWYGRPFDEYQANAFGVPRLAYDELLDFREQVEDRLFMNLPEAPTVDSVLDIARIQRRRYGINGFVIDPWSSLEVNRPDRRSASDYVGECLRKINTFCRQENVHAWIVAHPTKMRDMVTVQETDAEGNDTSHLAEPVIEPYDISESAHWYNMADFILSVWRDKVTTVSPDLVAVYVKKVRYDHLGSEGISWFKYDRRTSRYRDSTGSEGTVYQDRPF